MRAGVESLPKNTADVREDDGEEHGHRDHEHVDKAHVEEPETAKVSQ